MRYPFALNKGAIYCSACGSMYTYRASASLYQHIKAHHPGIACEVWYARTPQPCARCQEVYPPSPRYWHVESDRPGSPLVCVACGPAQRKERRSLANRALRWAKMALQGKPYTPRPVVNPMFPSTTETSSPPRCPVCKSTLRTHLHCEQCKALIGKGHHYKKAYYIDYRSYCADCAKEQS